MNPLLNLSKPQWDAALKCSRILRTCNTASAADRAEFWRSRDYLGSLLPDDADVGAIVNAAARWDAINSLFSGLVL